MKVLKNYCDYCGRETEEVMKIITPWSLIVAAINNQRVNAHPILKGDGCRECYESYREWERRRRSGDWFK